MGGRVFKMKIKILLIAFTLNLLPFVVMGADNITRDMIPRGSDFSSLRCDGGIISIGDLARQVLDNCGEPFRETRIYDEPYRIWVYRFGQSDHVYYIAFLYEKIHRIYRFRCGRGDPECN